MSLPSDCLEQLGVELLQPVDQYFPAATVVRSCCELAGVRGIVAYSGARACVLAGEQADERVRQVRIEAYSTTLSGSLLQVERSLEELAAVLDELLGSTERYELEGRQLLPPLAC